MDTKDYVLGRFSKEEKELINEAISETTKIIDDYLEIPFNDLMSRYNGVYDGLSE
jgi:peptidyl-tRNA hydrolase